MRLCSTLSDESNFVVLCPARDIRNLGVNGNEQVQELHHFCAQDLIQNQVFTFPPVSLAFFYDKLKQDEVLKKNSCFPMFISSSHHLCPKWPKELSRGFDLFIQLINMHVQQMEHVGMVVKTTNNHCALGIYLLQQSRNPVMLYNSKNSLFHRPRRTSWQLSTAKPMVVNADPMTLLAILRNKRWEALRQCVCPSLRSLARSSSRQQY
jgi:hypothetical protein